MGVFSDTILAGAQDAPEPQAEEQPGAIRDLPFARKQIAPSAPSFSDALLGGKSETPAQPLPSPQAEPDNRSLFRKGVDLVRGRQDPAYAGLKSFNEEMDAEKNQSAIGQMGLSAFMGGNDAAFGDTMKDTLGDRFIRKETDKFGHDIIVYKGQDGSEKKAYVNKPGLDLEDVTRGAMGAIPYVVGGGAAGSAMRGAGTGIRALAQGLIGSGTSLATDLGSMALGSEQGVDPLKAVVIGGLGAGGEAIATPLGWAWRKFVTEPGLYDKAAGKLTEKGVEAAKSMGIDPAGLTKELSAQFARTYSKSRGASEAAAQISTGAFDIPSTVGQRTKDAEKLLQEKAMRYGMYGENAKGIMQEFDKRQAEAVKNAAVGSIVPIPSAPSITAQQVKPGIATSLAPRRTPEQLNPETLGESIRGGLQTARESAKAGEKAAWEGATDLVPKPEAFQLLPQSLAGRIGSLRIDDRITPKAFSMAEDLQKFVSGNARTEGVPEILQQAPIRTVDEMRRRLLSTYRNTIDPQDRAAAGAIYNGFNDWIGKAAEQQMLLGKPEAAAALRTARGFTAEMRDMFAPRDAAGKATSGSRVLQDVMEKADSPERVVGALFFNQPQPSQIKQGSVEALGRIKSILERYGDKEVAQSTWNDIRAAYWMRLVQDKKGDMFTPGVMLGNIKNALTSQRSVIGTLYNQQELAQIRNFAKALETISYKDPNPSGSAVGIGSLARQFFSTLMNAIGLNSTLAKAVMEYSGVGKAYGTAAAKSAVNPAMRAVRPNIGGLAEAAGAEAYDPSSQ